MTNTLALVVGHSVPAPRYSLLNSILAVAATFLFIAIVVMVSLAALTRYSRRHGAPDHDDLSDPRDE